MDVSPTQAADTSSVGVEALKKSMEVAERSALKVLESATEQSQQTTAQKTGIGSNINITG